MAHLVTGHNNGVETPLLSSDADIEALPFAAFVTG